MTTGLAAFIRSIASPPRAPPARAARQRSSHARAAHQHRTARRPLALGQRAECVGVMGVASCIHASRSSASAPSSARAVKSPSLRRIIATAARKRGCRTYRCAPARARRPWPFRRRTAAAAPRPAAPNSMPRCAADSGESVASLPVNRGIDGRGVIVVHEGAGAIVDGFARDRHIVGVHNAVDEADAHPFRDERDLPRHHPASNRSSAPDCRTGPPPADAAPARNRPAFAAPACRATPPHIETCRRADGSRRRASAPRRAASARALSPVSATARLRVVAIPSANIASDMMNSRSIGASAALPSPPRE